jgi:uncharacterized protein
LRLETYLSTQPPAPGKNARLSHSYENSGGAQCIAAPPSEEPSSPDSLKSSFDLSSFPQDFSAATPKRVSAGLRRRAAPQRVIMHGLLPAQRVTTFTFGDHHASASGKCCPAQSPAAPSARSVPAEPGEPSGRLGHPGQSPRGSGESRLRGAPTGTVAAVSPATAEVGDRLQVTGNRKSINQRPVPCDRLPITFGGLVKLLVLGAIRFYQACLSPVLPSACRHYPSCSAYAFEAVEKWGVWKGGRLALGRLLRCRPWGSYGYDPVPERQVPGVRCQVSGENENRNSKFLA